MGFPSAQYSVSVVPFAPVEYLTYGIRTIFVLLRAVGDDAHIVPAERADITEICGEFDGTLGSMCSIDPYEVSEVDVRAIGPTQCEEENP